MTGDMPAQDRWCGATLITGLGGPQGWGDQTMAGNGCLSQNDDGSSPAIDITPYFPGGLRFFDMTHTRVYVNTNGNITFSGPESTYTPEAFPVAARPMIAPFWADVDIRMADGRCNESLGTTCTSCTPCYVAPTDGVWWHLEAGPPARAIFTWDEVGYYSCHVDRRQSFQLVLTQATGGCSGGPTGGGTDFDVEFRFNRCEWDTGDASGGVGGFLGPFGFGEAAQSGFDAGNSRDYVEIMGSRMTRVINRRLCEESNVMPPEPGVWRFLVRGGVVMCPDAGTPCTVPGQMGACAEGRTNCVGSGTECIQQVTPTPERCDAIDNDCDGMADEMDSGPLCAGTERCMMGRCIDVCFEGGCPTGETCTPTGCIEDACVGVMCPASERCSGGTCVAACSGVVCPHGQACVSGRCVDVCSGLTCDDCTVCVDGACVPRCSLSPCPAGETCGADERCIESACTGVSCPAPTFCRGGSCVDPCDGAVCPEGEICMMGSCVPAPVDAGVMFPDAERGDSGMPSGVDTGLPPFDAGQDGGRRMPPDRNRECGCRAPGASRSFDGWVALAAVAGAIALRRRRR
jgi:MYXO-CTERM domain-containing protein